jgi:AcrR family transcriptional regulator
VAAVAGLVAAPVQRLDPRVLRTRELVAKAFMAELERLGFEALSVQDVVQRAGINRATFYDHFEDKFALAKHVLRGGLEDAVGASGLRTRGLDAVALKLLMQTICEFLSAVHTHCKPPYTQVDSLVETQAVAMVKDMFAAWLRRPPAGWRKLSPSQRELSATAASWALYGLALSGITKAGRTPGRASIASAVPHVASLLGAPGGGRRRG